MDEIRLDVDGAPSETEYRLQRVADALVRVEGGLVPLTNAVYSVVPRNIQDLARAVEVIETKVTCQYFTMGLMLVLNAMTFILLVRIAYHMGLVGG